jgi:hypothetical protein
MGLIVATFGKVDRTVTLMTTLLNLRKVVIAKRKEFGKNIQTKTIKYLR